MKMKKILSGVLAVLMLAGCASAEMSGEITVMSREDGSGTRGAFVELTGVEQKNEAGEKVDNTTVEANITNSTSVMITSVAGTTTAIGYISLGSLNDTVKAISVDGVAPSVDTIKSGEYALARPFNIVTTGEVGELAQDFIRYILSAEGQAVIEENGYIAIAEDAESYSASGLQGEVTVGGSSSVTPVMEKLAEHYMALNKDMKVSVQQSDSTTGVTSALEGIFDIGMASRALKDSELEAGAQGTAIAMDGIAVIVNPENPVSDLATEAIRKIFTGEMTDWADAQ